MGPSMPLARGLRSSRGRRRSPLPLIPWRHHSSRPGEAQSEKAACCGWAAALGQSNSGSPAPSPTAPSPVAQERDNRTEPCRGGKRASEGGPADGAQRQQKRHKAAKDTEGGSQPKDLAPPPPPLPATLLPKREPRSGLPAPSPNFIPPFQEGAAADPTPNPPPPRRRRPGTGRGRGGHNGIAATTRIRASTPEQTVGSPARKGGGGAGALQPALGTPRSHGRGQASGASRVAWALHPKEAQEGSGGCGGRHSKQGTSTSTRTPSCSRSARDWVGMPRYWRPCRRCTAS